MARIDLKENEYMERFVSQDHADSNDNQFWYQLLSCSFNFMRVQDPKIVEKTLDPYIVRLTLNNSQSFNIGSLVRVFLDRAARVKPKGGQSANPYYVFQSFNALYLLRTICKSYIENLSEEQLIKSLRAVVDVIPKMPSVTMQQQNVALPPHLTQSQSINGPPNSAGAITPVSQSNGIPVNQVAENSAPTVQNSQTIQQPNPLTPVTPQTADGKPVPTTEESAKRIDFTSGATMLDQFISTLISILVDIPVTDSTYFLQVEAINSLLVLLSIQMYSATPANQSVIYKCLMQKKASIHALILTKTLLNNFVNQYPMPQEGGSIIIGLASGLWKVLTLGYGAQEEDDTETMPLLAKHSLLLLNVLTNYYTSDKNPYREAIVSCQDSRYNLSDPRTALENANNDVLATATTSKDALSSNSIKIDFHELYKTICKYLHDNQVALLLYLLLHSNKIYKPYILTTASSELDLLVLPLLRILYSSIDKKGSHHVYMVLIIFIIMSEETAFNEALYKISVRHVPWYTDRVLSDISLGSLTTLIMIRSFQFNTFRIKDRFLHTNLFATLANLSNHFADLHPYVCQRLIDLLDRLSKKYLSATKNTIHEQQQLQSNTTLEVFTSDNALARALATDTSNKQDIQEDVSAYELDSTAAVVAARPFNNQVPRINRVSIPAQQVVPQSPSFDSTMVLPPLDSMSHMNQYQATDSSVSGQQSPNSNNSASDHVNISMEDTKQDLTLIEEVIRMILEVINNSLASQLSGNTNLIYTLLYKRNVLTSLLSSHQSFYTMVINIERILTFFYNKVEAADRQLTVDEIKSLIQTSSKEWNFIDQSRDPNANLKFLYMEHEQPEEFFIPYIWTHIFYSSGIVWNSKRIVLFNPDEV